MPAFVISRSVCLLFVIYLTASKNGRLEKVMISKVLLLSVGGVRSRKFASERGGLLIHYLHGQTSQASDRETSEWWLPTG